MNSVTQSFEKVNCQIDVYQKEVQNYMIITAQRLVERESTSLAKVFEINGKRLEVLCGVH